MPDAENRAGIVAAKGPRAHGFEVGDRVWGCSYMNPNGGFYADHVVVEANHVGHVPPQLDLVHAGMSLVTALTAVQGLGVNLCTRPAPPSIAVAGRVVRRMQLLQVAHLFKSWRKH